MSNLSVFDKLQNYSSRKPSNKKNVITEVLDTSTTQGAFLAQVHNAGYKIFNSLEWYREDNETLVVPQEVYDTFDDGTKQSYKPRVKEYSELYYALTTKGNQEINAIAGSGKALVNGTSVLTNLGYKPIETLKVGDYVYSDDGKLHKIRGKYPQGKKQEEIVVFSDDNKIPCSKDHLWTLEDGRIKRTEELSVGDSLPSISAVEFSEREVTLNPYVLGVLYAKGYSYNEEIRFRTTDIGLLENVIDLYPIRTAWEEDDTYTILFDRSLNLFCHNLNLFSSNTDFVLPKEYIYTSVKNRKDLLLGLLDTFGEVFNNKYVLGIKNERFAKDIIFIAESLGLIVESEKFKDKFLIYMATTLNSVSFHTTDRLSEVVPTVRTVKEIIDTKEEKEMTCIEIDSASHLYLTEHCIPTHNTTALIFKVMHDIVTGEAMVQLKNADVSTVNKMWVCTFLKSGAGELGEKLAYWQKRFGYLDTHNQVIFSTLDAEFKRCLNAMGVATPLDSERAEKLLKETIDDLGIRRDGEPLRQEDYSTISSIVTYYRGRLTNKYSHPSAVDYCLNGKVMDLLVQQFADKRRINGIMDFDEMSEILYQYLYVTPNPKVQDFVASRYNYIYIDEFQDTSQLAYAILKFYARGKLAVNNGKKTVVAVNYKESLKKEDGKEFSGLITNIGTRGKVVVIGDTSQCVVKGTQIEAEDGTILVEDLKSGDKVKSCIGKGKTDSIEVDEVRRTWYEGKVIHIKTLSGKDLQVTSMHKMFVKEKIKTEPLCLVQFDGEFKNWVYESTLYNNSYEHDKEVIQDTDVDKLEEKAYNMQSSMYRRAELIKNHQYSVVLAKYLKENDIICISDNGLIVEDKIISVEEEKYKGFVYDINLKTRNFIANGIVSHNCIYSFRGSDSTILAVEFAKDFAPTKCALSYNWRCPANILNPIVPCIHQNTYSKNQLIQASKDGGDFFAYDFSTYKAMVDKMQLDVEKDLNDGLNVAILVRTNYDGAVPAFVLATNAKYDFSLSGNSMTLSTALPRKLLKMTSLLTEKTTPAVLSCLLDLCSYTDRFAVRNMIATLKGSNKGIWDVPMTDIHYSCASLEPFVVYMRTLYFTDGKKDKSKEMLALRGMYVWLHDRVYTGQSTYAESARAYLETILYILDSAEFESVYDFIEEMDYIGEKLKGKVGKEKAPITIATVHESKGKEYDSVYVWNVIDGQFPSNKTNMNNINDLEEERRIFYIACTRAKKREHIYTVQGRHSMFLDEMDVELKNPISPSLKLKKEE